jgi:hypothetical protein
LIFKLKEFTADKEKLEIVQPACRPACRQAGRQVRKDRFPHFDKATRRR